MLYDQFITPCSAKARGNWIVMLLMLSDLFAEFYGK